MLQQFRKAQRIFGILLVGILALVHANAAFSGCATADAGSAASMSAMDDCQGCSKGSTDGSGSYDAVANICGYYCLQNYVTPTQGAELLAPSAATPVYVATALPRISPQIRIQAIFPGKARLIYRLQRLLI